MLILCLGILLGKLRTSHPSKRPQLSSPSSLQISAGFGGELKISKKQKAAKLPHCPGSVRRQFERGELLVGGSERVKEHYWPVEVVE